MKDDVFNLSGKVALVTGAGSGIGRATTLELARSGAHVVISGINLVDKSLTEGELNLVAGQVREQDREAITVAADVRYQEDVEKVIKQTMEHFGRIDILVNNAGGSLSPFRSFTELSEESWDAHIQENLKTAFLCLKAVGPIMMAQGSGNIIGITSITAIVGGEKRASYATAKAGIVNLTKTLAIEWAPYNIRVNCIVPGFIATAGMKMVRSQENLAALADRVPLRRLGEPEDIAKAVLFLASNLSDYITGQALIVDGGWSQSLAKYF